MDLDMLIERYALYASLDCVKPVGSPMGCYGEVGGLC